MSQKNRKEKRVKKNLLAYSDNGSFDLVGISSNISKGGIFIESPHPDSSENEISIVLAVGNDLFKLKGEVQWCKSAEDREPVKIPMGMGIRLTEAPAEYLNYVEYIKHTLGNGITQMGLR